MKWYKGLYIGYNLLEDSKEVIKNIEKGKILFNKYVIVLPRNNYDTLEIYPSNVLNQKFYRNMDLTVVGIASGKEEALDMVNLIVMDCYNSTGNVKVKDFIEKQMT